MEVKIITPDSTLFNGEATLVVVPGIDGQIGILNNHAPLVSSLVKGAVKVKHNDKEDLFDI
ncbi:MAG: F0F1 ATP synthase subunit epsilon, partial [Bacteroidota bacterium]|nr:F0F1 ATP synthase subunit epsilon [Bacteroidota bacterium]